MSETYFRDLLSGPIFDPLRPALARLPPDRWPAHDELSALADGIGTGRGRPIRFVAPRAHTDRERRYYELHIADTGEVETRPENWHDLFNALVWVSFPRAKAAINEQHAAILEERGEPEARRRGPERDALTLFDEGGVVVASTAPRLMQLIADFEWKELFWRRREELLATTRFFAFGHACYEQALEPYLGMVAKTIFVSVDPAFIAGSIEAQLERADDLVARHFADRTRFASPKSMSPMPVLGVPGWHRGPQDEAFYGNRTYFRPKRPKKGV